MSDGNFILDRARYNSSSPTNLCSQHVILPFIQTPSPETWELSSTLPSRLPPTLSHVGSAPAHINPPAGPLQHLLTWAPASPGPTRLQRSASSPCFAKPKVLPSSQLKSKFLAVIWGHFLILTQPPPALYWVFCSRHSAAFSVPGTQDFSSPLGFPPYCPIPGDTLPSLATQATWFRGAVIFPGRLFCLPGNLARLPLERLKVRRRRDDRE